MKNKTGLVKEAYEKAAEQVHKDLSLLRKIVMKEGDVKTHENHRRNEGTQAYSEKSE